MRLRTLLGLIFSLGAAVWLLDNTLWPQGHLGARAGSSLTAAKNWGYQLQRVHTTLIPAPLDILVVDYARDEGLQEARTVDEVEALRKRPDGTNRIVLAYMSVGEAENYRFYWRRHWQYRAPSWLARENSEWKGNFHVRFWDPGWQRILMDQDRTMLDTILDIVMPSRKAYLDRILEAGFDGIYLDRVDAYYEGSQERTTAEADMVALVGRLSTYAKQRRPGFLVVPQNGEELLQFAPYRKSIDAVAKEDLVLGIAGAEQENTAGDLARSIQLLELAKADGKPIFVVEYAQSPNKRALVRERLDRRGYIVHFAHRELNVPPELYQPTAAPIAKPPSGPMPPAPVR